MLWLERRLSHNLAKFKLDVQKFIDEHPGEGVLMTMNSMYFYAVPHQKNWIKSGQVFGISFISAWGRAFLTRWK